MAGDQATSTRAPQPGNGKIAADSGAAGTPGKQSTQASADLPVTSLSAMPAGSWFTFAFWLAAGGITAYALVRVVSGLGSLLSILLLAVFFATALDPMVTALVNRGLRRSLAVTVVALGVLALIAGFVAVVFPPVDKEVNSLIEAIPGYLDDLRNKSTYLGKLEEKYQFVEKAKSWIDANRAGTLDLNGILGAGKAVFSILTGTLTAIALTLYFVANMPGIKRFGYHLVPIRRRPRVAELTDRILAQVGRYVIGQMVIASIGGFFTWAWALAWGIPYPAALGVVVALFGLVPVVGSSIGGAIVTLVALTVSVKVAIATLVYYVAARLAEDYLVAPRVNRRTVDVHPMVTILAVLAGAALFGVVGALVAIPAAVAIKMVATEVLLPRIDEM
ncbi:MAG: AI-2E family transporter [Catenulisporales bacterium]|nr:AI-2E family transporter [Catenulisporales bacterium]